MQVVQHHSLQNKAFFYTILVVLSALSLWLVSSYLDIIAFSLVMVIVMKPVYDFFDRLWNGRTAASTLATLTVLVLAVLLPGAVMVGVINNQVMTIVDQITAAGASQPLTLHDLQDQINELIVQVPFGNNFVITDAQLEQLDQAMVTLFTALGSSLVNLGMSIPDLMARLFIFIAILGVLLPNYDSFARRLMVLSPLDDEVDRIFLRKTKVMVWSMFIGIAVIALVQGLVTGAFFWLGGVPYTPLWTLVAIFTSMLPLGASIIVIPIAIVQFISRQYVGGLIVLGGYLLVVTNLDNLLRPRLVSREAYLNAALVLVAALGGYNLFGFFGVIYGPVLMVLLMTTIDVYADYYAKPGRPADAQSTSPPPPPGGATPHEYPTGEAAPRIEDAPEFAYLAALEKLGELHERGILSDEEFGEQKQWLLTHRRPQEPFRDDAD